MFVIKNEAPTVNNYEKTFKIIMDLSENQRRKFLKYMSLFMAISVHQLDSDV